MFKKLFFLSFVLISFCGINMKVSLGGDKPLLVKTSKNHAGFLADRREESCKLYPGEIHVYESNGGIDITHIYEINVDEDINEIILAAEDEEVSKSSSKLGCDDPGTAVTAYTDENRQVILYTAGGCASPRMERKGPNSKYLMDLVGSYCKTTY
jgi:hypothetical protein